MSSENAKKRARFDAEMSENKSSADPIAEFQKLRKETAGMNDKLTNTFQFADSRPTSNIEVLKELHAIREILETREEAGEDQKKQEAQVSRLIEELEASRAENADLKKNSAELTNEVREMKEKLAHQEDVNRSILEELREIRKEMANVKSNVTQSIIEEIIGEWVVEKKYDKVFYIFRKFERNDAGIAEFCSDNQIFSNPPISIDVSKTLNNRLINGDRSYYVENSKIHICDKGALCAVYRKIN